MGYIQEGLLLEGYIASEIWGAYFREGLFYFIFFFGGGGGRLLSEFYRILKEEVRLANNDIILTNTVFGQLYFVT